MPMAVLSKEARHHRDDEFHAEAFAVFVQVWYAHMPQIPEDRGTAVWGRASSRTSRSPGRNALPRASAF